MNNLLLIATIELAYDPLAYYYILYINNIVTGFVAHTLI